MTISEKASKEERKYDLQAHKRAFKVLYSPRRIHSIRSTVGYFHRVLKSKLSSKEDWMFHVRLQRIPSNKNDTVNSWDTWDLVAITDVGEEFLRELEQLEIEVELGEVCLYLYLP